MTTAQELPNDPNSSPASLEFTAAPPSPGAQPDYPSRSSGESHQQDELSPVNRVIPSDEPERGIWPSRDPSSSRCQFTFSDGRRCRNLAAELCVHHGSNQRDPSGQSDALGAPELVPLCADLTSATSVNRALTQVFLLMAQGRISQKQAVAFGYISQLLLQTLPGVRSEYVSVYDPNSWRAKIQASLELTIRPGSSSRAKNLSEGPLCDQSEPGTQKRPRQDHDRPAVKHPSVVIPSEDSERRIPLKPLAPEEKPDSAPLPINGSDLNELEEREPAESMSPSVRVAEVVTLVPRGSPPQQSSSKVAETAASLPSPAPARRLARDFYGNPIPPADWWCHLPGAAAAIQRPPQPETGKADLSLPRSNITPAGSGSASDRVIPADAKNSTPVATSSSQPEIREPLAPNRHTTPWFVPASWSGRPRPDPCPTGAAERRGKFRSMANSAFRRIQHQNSRGFWSPDMKHLAT